jgi:hypothetical protein
MEELNYMETITITFHNGTTREFKVNMSVALNLSSLLYELTKENIINTSVVDNRSNVA